MEFMRDYMEKEEGESTSNITPPKSTTYSTPADQSDDEDDDFECDRGSTM